MAMSAVIAYREAKSGSTSEWSGKWSESQARSWISRKCQEAKDRSVRISIRKLMKLWGWSSFAVRNLLDRMEEVGQISRKVLPMNGGTLITLASQQAVGDVPTKNVTWLRAGTLISISQIIDNLPSVLTAHQLARLSQTYEAIIYGEPGYEWATIEHLEIIEQALSSPQIQQAA